MYNKFIKILSPWKIIDDKPNATDFFFGMDNILTPSEINNKMRFNSGKKIILEFLI